MQVTTQTGCLNIIVCSERERERIRQKRQGERLKRQTEKDANIEERENERKGQRQRQTDGGREKEEVNVGSYGDIMGGWETILYLGERRNTVGKKGSEIERDQENDKRL